jgi:predicted small secreted protein
MRTARKNMPQKISALLIVLTSAFLLTACGGGNTTRDF